jgi:hypothetical protein
MGIDGKLRYGLAIMINPVYLPVTQRENLDRLTHRYPTLFDCDQYDNNPALFLWAQEPSQIFPTERTQGRRPLILTDTTSLSLLRPTPLGVDLNSEELWQPSYEKFIVYLGDEVRPNHDELINRLARVAFDLDDEEPDYDPRNGKTQAYLSQRDILDLRELIDNKPHTLEGMFLTYLLS